MKRWLSALLALCLLIAAVPAAFSEAVSEAVDAPVAEVELDLDGIEAVLSEAPEAAEEAEAANGESAKTVGDWVNNNGRWYMYYSDGRPLNGIFEIHYGTNQDGTYCFGSDGAVLTGWQYWDKGKMWRFFDPVKDRYGYAGKEKVGWIKVGNAWYYSKGTNGGRLTGKQKIDGNYYFFAGNGILYIDCWVWDGSKWYHPSYQGNLLTGWHQIGGNRMYHFAEDGTMDADKWVLAGTSWYYVGETGEMCRNKWIPSGKDWYYVGGNGAMCTDEWIQSGKYWYYVGKTGKMVTGWQKIDGYWYIFRNDGVMLTGWINKDGYWYYLDPTGRMHTGWLKYKGEYYYMDPSTGRMTTYFRTIDKVTYYFGADGWMRTRWVYYKNDWYFFDANGAMHVGWLTDKGKTYFFRGSGVMVTGKQTIGGTVYYFDLSGALLGSDESATTIDLSTLMGVSKVELDVLAPQHGMTKTSQVSGTYPLIKYDSPDGSFGVSYCPKSLGGYLEWSCGLTSKAPKGVTIFGQNTQKTNQQIESYLESNGWRYDNGHLPPGAEGYRAVYTRKDSSGSWVFYIDSDDYSGKPYSIGLDFHR